MGGNPKLSETDRIDLLQLCLEDLSLRVLHASKELLMCHTSLTKLGERIESMASELKLLADKHKRR